MKLLFTLPLALSALASAAYTPLHTDEEQHLSARGLATRPKCMDRFQPHPPQWCLTMYQRRLWCTANENECKEKRPWLHKKLNDIDEPRSGRKHGRHGKNRHGGRHGKKTGKKGKHPKRPKMRNPRVPNQPFPAPEGKPHSSIMLDPKPSPTPKFMFHESVHGGSGVEKRDVPPTEDVPDPAEIDQNELNDIANDAEIQAHVNDGAWESDDDDEATDADTDTDDNDDEFLMDPPEVYMDEFEPNSDSTPLQRRQAGTVWVGPASIQPSCMKHRTISRKMDGPLSAHSKGKGDITVQCKVKALRRIWCNKNPGRCYHYHRKFFLEMVKLLRKAKRKEEAGGKGGHKHGKGGKGGHGHGGKGGKGGKGKGVGGKNEGRPAPGTRPHMVPHHPGAHSKHENRPAPGTRPHALAEPPNGGVKFHKGITGYGGRPNPHVLPDGVVPKVSRRGLEEDEQEDGPVGDGIVSDGDIDESEDEADEGIDSGSDIDDGTITDGDYDSDSDDGDADADSDTDLPQSNNDNDNDIAKRDVFTMIREVFAQNGLGVRRTPMCYRKYKKVGKEDQVPKWCRVINDRRHKCLDNKKWCVKNHPWLWRALHGGL